MTNFPQLVANLKRTASHASYTMTVDTSMVLKLISAAELAEAELASVDSLDEPYDSDVDQRLDADVVKAHVAYRKATNQ